MTRGEVAALKQGDMVEDVYGRPTYDLEAKLKEKCPHCGETMLDGYPVP